MYTYSGSDGDISRDPLYKFQVKRHYAILACVVRYYLRENRIKTCKNSLAWGLQLAGEVRVGSGIERKPAVKSMGSGNFRHPAPLCFNHNR